MHHSSLFQYFYYDPYSTNFLVYLFFNFFGNTITMIMIMIEIQYSSTVLLLLMNTSKQWHCALQLYQLLCEKKTAMFMKPIIQQYESKLFKNNS